MEEGRRTVHQIGYTVDSVQRCRRDKDDTIVFYMETEGKGAGL